MHDWPHAPLHRLEGRSAVMVTASTLGKARHFNTPDKLELLCEALLFLAREHCVLLQAWCVTANHYHFVAILPDDPVRLRTMIRRLHAGTATQLNRLDGTPGRKVWFQYWDTVLTNVGSFYARLNYVHQNAVHHRLVREAPAYPWCSAAWFERSANPSFYQTIMSMKTDRVKVIDDFDWVGS